MGAASSMSSQDMTKESDDWNELQEIYDKVAGLVKDDERCSRYCQPVLEKAPPKAGDVEGWKERRDALVGLVQQYLAVINACGGSPPTSVDALIEAQKSGPVMNLSCADRDDDEVPGMMYTFSLALISVFPPAIFSLGETLTTLSLKKNRIKELPAEIAALKALKELDLSENELSALGDDVCTLSCLEKLNISENKIEALPARIGDLKNLQVLVAFKNMLTVLPDSIGECEALEEVNFFNNKLIKVPDSISDLENLVDLNLGGNKLKMCPSTKKWKNLERLALSWNTIVVLQDFGGMVNLKQLQMNRNQLSELPDDAFEGCTSLESVDLSTNRLEKIPASLCQCSTVSTMDFTSNQLTELPDLSAMENIHILKVGSNLLTDLSAAGLGKCRQLETLFVNANKLTSLPGDLVNLVHLTRMNITANAELDKTSADAQALIENLSNRCKANKGKWIA